MPDTPKSELQLKLEDARAYFKGDNSKSAAAEQIVELVSPKIKETIKKYFSNPETALKGLKDEDKAYEAIVSTVLVKVILDEAVTAETLELNINNAVTEFLDKRVTKTPTINKTKKSASRKDDIRAVVSSIQKAIEDTKNPDIAIPVLSATLMAETDVDFREIVDALADARYDAGVFSDFVNSLNDDELEDVFTFIRDHVVKIANKVISTIDNDAKLDVSVLVAHDFLVSNIRHEEEEKLLGDKLDADISTLSPAEQRLVHRHKALADKIKKHKGGTELLRLVSKYLPKVRQAILNGGVNIVKEKNPEDAKSKDPAVREAYQNSITEEEVESIAEEAVFKCVSRPEVLNKSFDVTLSRVVFEVLNANHRVKPQFNLKDPEDIKPQDAEEFIKNNDPFVRGFRADELFHAFKRTIWEVAWDFADRLHPYGITVDDLFSYGGATVFTNCLAKYDPSKEAKFNTFLYKSLINEFYRLGNWYRTQRRAPHAKTQTGETVSAPGLQQSLATPLSQTEEGEDKVMEDVLKAPEGGAAEQVESVSEAMENAKEMLDFLLKRSNADSKKTEVCYDLFNEMITKGHKHSLTEIAKRHGMTQNIPTIQGWAGRLVYPALLFALGKYGEGEEAVKRVLEYSRSGKGVNLQLFNLMLTDRYDVSQKSTTAPVVLYQTAKPQEEKELAEAANDMLEEISPVDLSRALSQINTRIDRINSTFSISLPNVSNAADIKKLIDATPATMFNILNSLMDVQPEDVRRLKTAKFSSEDDVRNNTDQAMLWMKDFLTGYNNEDSAAIEKTFLKLIEKDDNAAALKAAYGHAKSFGFVAKDGFFKAVKGNDLKVDELVVRLCEIANDARISNRLDLEEAADKANDLYLALSPEEEAAFKKAVRDLEEPALRTAIFDIANAEFSTDSFIKAAISMGLSLVDMSLLTKEVIIPMLGGEYVSAEEISAREKKKIDDENILALQKVYEALGSTLTLAQAKELYEKAKKQLSSDTGHISKDLLDDLEKSEDRVTPKNKKKSIDEKDAAESETEEDDLDEEDTEVDIPDDEEGHKDE